MAVEVDESLVLLMHDTLRTCANAVEMNGPAQYMLAQEIADQGKPVDEVTLGELQGAMERVDVRYHRMTARLDKRPCNIYRKVMPQGVCVQGSWYTGPEIADLVGEEVTIEIYPENSLTLVARHGQRCFQLHAMEAQKPITTWLNSAQAEITAAIEKAGSQPGQIAVDCRGVGEFVACELEKAGLEVTRVWPKGPFKHDVPTGWRCSASKRPSASEEAQQTPQPHDPHLGPAATEHPGQAEI